MNGSSILLPFFGVMLLTFLVWIYMYTWRLAFLIGQRIDLRTVDTPDKADSIIPGAINHSSNNLKKLFELPVIFYAVCLYLYASGGVNRSYVIAAWCFLVFRVVHSVIHCTCNNVRHRFTAYVLSAIALWAMVIRAFAELVVFY